MIFVLNYTVISFFFQEVLSKCGKSVIKAARIQEIKLEVIFCTIAPESAKYGASYYF